MEKNNEKLEDIKRKYDEKLKYYIARLYQAINGEKMDLTVIKNSVDALNKFFEHQEYNYLNNLLYPEKCKGVKIPSPVPVPSCSFQLHNSVTLQTNREGNLGIIFSPFFLAHKFKENENISDFEYTAQPSIPDYAPVDIHTYPEYLSSFFVNNHYQLTGSSPNIYWRPVNIGQQIPPVYNQYRLVSASIVVRYIGRLDIASGVIGGAIVFDDAEDVGLAGKITFRRNEYVATVTNGIMETIGENYAKYGNFDLAMDSFYHQENSCIEGIRELYFPIDNYYEEYSPFLNLDELKGRIDRMLLEPPGRNFINIETKRDILRNGFKYMIYVLGAPSNSCFKCDIYCNFECLPNAEFLNYLPLTLNTDPITAKEKKETILIVQQEPIMKADK